MSIPQLPPPARHPLRLLRQAEGWSQLEVAAAAGVAIQTVRRIEAGDVATLHLVNLVKVAHAVGCRPADLAPGLLVEPRGPCPQLRAKATGPSRRS